ncbi:hypothetical protein FGO68_gene12264 [Halteria grandinella]|uniref:Uncharacterized protein n=1 Tax=Halteria grandinella TaxID=5974 RepID=A0A8J8T0S1_HALGN|nr:hypothetical protein FGO68_gene12264 [Halteria grandinella]
MGNAWSQSTKADKASGIIQALTKVGSAVLRNYGKLTKVIQSLYNSIGLTGEMTELALCVGNILEISTGVVAVAGITLSYYQTKSEVQLEKELEELQMLLPNNSRVIYKKQDLQKDQKDINKAIDKIEELKGRLELNIKDHSERHMKENTKDILEQMNNLIDSFEFQRNKIVDAIDSAKKTIGASKWFEFGGYILGASCFIGGISQLSFSTCGLFATAGLILGGTYSIYKSSNLTQKRKQLQDKISQINEILHKYEVNLQMMNQNFSKLANLKNKDIMIQVEDFKSEMARQQSQLESCRENIQNQVQNFEKCTVCKKPFEEGQKVDTFKSLYPIHSECFKKGKNKLEALPQLNSQVQDLEKQAPIENN